MLVWLTEARSPTRRSGTSANRCLLNWVRGSQRAGFGGFHVGAGDAHDEQHSVEVRERQRGVGQFPQNVLGVEGNTQARG